MDCKEFEQTPMIEVPREVFFDLIVADTRLKMLEYAIKQKGEYESIGDIQNMFGLKKGNENE